MYSIYTAVGSSAGHDTQQLQPSSVPDT